MLSFRCAKLRATLEERDAYIEDIKGVKARCVEMIGILWLLSISRFDATKLEAAKAEAQVQALQLSLSDSKDRVVELSARGVNECIL